MLAWIGSAFVDFNLAAFPSIAWLAVADELIDAVFATTVNAGIGGTFVNITQASRIVVSPQAFALEAVDEVDAHAVVGTWR